GCDGERCRPMTTSLAAGSDTTRRLQWNPVGACRALPSRAVSVVGAQQRPHSTRHEEFELVARAHLRVAVLWLAAASTPSFGGPGSWARQYRRGLTRLTGGHAVCVLPARRSISVTTTSSSSTIRPPFASRKA